MKRILKAALITAAFAALTGCASPTVKTHVAVSSKLSMTPELNEGLYAMPDWGDKIAIVTPKSKSPTPPVSPWSPVSKRFSQPHTSKRLKPAAVKNTA